MLEQVLGVRHKVELNMMLGFHSAVPSLLRDMGLADREDPIARSPARIFISSGVAGIPPCVPRHSYVTHANRSPVTPEERADCNCLGVAASATLGDRTFRALQVEAVPGV